MTSAFTPYSSLKAVATLQGPMWYPEEERDRVASYIKYDELYWNDDTQFALRVLEGESPIYIPNARTIVDTTSHYLLKGLQINPEDPEKFGATNDALTAFLKREAFYSRFHVAKHAGVARGDFVLHLTADPAKPAGSRLSLTPVDPCDVIPVYDDDDITKLIRVHLIQLWWDAKQQQNMLRKLTYENVLVDGSRRISRSEGLYKLDDTWYGQKPELMKAILPEALLPPSITTIPVYWFKNIDWEGQQYGSSELRGFEALLRGTSQAGSDQAASLSLEGLGVYATDGGSPIDDQGNEVEWEIAPGKVMEVPTGSYFRRVEGLSTLKPSMDHINYLESKMREAGGLSDVALGRVDVQTAQSGIALAIKFMPTLAKIEERDQAGVDRLTQLFFDWKSWMSVYEGETLDGDILVTIGQKLPDDRAEMLNELNNMIDRKIISAQYYRGKMTELGWVFPDDIAEQISKEQDEAIRRQREVALANANATSNNNLPPESNPDNGRQQRPANRSNNKNKSNESAGTEAGQTPNRQARGGTSQ